MMGRTHLLAGALTGAAWAAATHQPADVLIFSTIAATATASGPFSPDVDQTEAWARIPGRGGPLRHRGITHWPGIPALAWWAVTAHVPADRQWPWIVLLLGWCSHLAGDALFGKIPLLGWYCYVGFNLDTDGLLESGKVKLPAWAFWDRDKRWTLPVAPARLVLSGALAVTVWVGLTHPTLTHILPALPAFTRGA